MMPQQLGRYVIEDLLGEGAFAWVYRAKDADLDRAVALKVLKPAWLSDPQALSRFKQEAKTMARLHHPHIATIYEVGQAEGQVYLAQFLVEGETLAARLARGGALPWPKILDILRPVASALDYAHSQGIVHRDIKPSNILLDKNDHPYLGDFGLVRAAEGSASLSASVAGVKGTGAYIPPEVWEGAAATPASDVYALSCVVFEMLTGEVLFEGSSMMAVMRKHDKGPEFPAAWPPGVPAGVTEVLQRGLAKEPTKRIQSVGELVTALAALSASSPAPTAKSISEPVKSKPLPVPPFPVDEPELTPYISTSSSLASPSSTLWWKSRRSAIVFGVVLFAVLLIGFWLFGGRPTPLSPFFTDSGFWAVAMSNNREVGQQIFHTSPDFPTQFIETNWGQDFDVTSLAYGNNIWAVVMSNNREAGQQIFHTSPDFPAQFIETNWGQDFDVTSLAYGNNIWAVVMSNNREVGQQIFHTSPDFPTQFIETNWNKGFSVTSLAR